MARSIATAHPIFVDRAEGIEFVKPGDDRLPDAEFAQRVIDAARKNGLLVIKYGVYRNIIRLPAPLTTSLNDCQVALQKLDAAIAGA